MPTLATNAYAPITLAPGAVLSVSPGGDGLVTVVGLGGQAPVNYPLSGQGGTFGPYGATVKLTVFAKQALSYNVNASSGQSIRSETVKRDSASKLLLSDTGVVSNSYRNYSPPSFSKWGAARNRGASSPARVLHFGDSNIAGEGAGTNTLGLDGAARLGMVDQFSSLAGHNSMGMIGEQNVTTGSVAINVYDPRFTLGTGWAANAAADAIGGRFIVASGGAAGLLSFAPGAPFDRFEFWYPQTSGGNTAFTVAVDGVTIDTINQAGANGYIKKTYSVALGTHTISFGVGATGTGFVSAILPYVADGTPIVLKGGHCGVLATTLAQASSPWSARAAAVALAPDFVHLYCTINDVKVPTAANTYRTQMEAIVAALSATADGVICMGYPTTANGMTDGAADRYAAQLISLAADYGWGFFDSRGSWGGSNVAATAMGYRFDNDHPNLAGHARYAADLYTFLKASGLN